MPVPGGKPHTGSSAAARNSGRRDGETGTHEVFHRTSNRTVVHNLRVIARQPTAGDYQLAA